jgi:hypothetical protein
MKKHKKSKITHGRRGGKRSEEPIERGLREEAQSDVTQGVGRRANPGTMREGGEMGGDQSSRFGTIEDEDERGL